MQTVPVMMMLEGNACYTSSPDVHCLQVLEDARYDKIAAVRTAAAAALAKFSALPDPPKPAEAAAPAAPGTPSAAGGGGFSGSGRRSGKGSTAKERTRQPGSVLLRQTPGSRSDR